MFLASTRIARDSVTCHICLCPFRSVIPKSSFFFARIYNHCQIYHRWKWVKQRKHPKPGLPIFTLGSKDTGKEIVTELIGPIPFIRKKKKKDIYMAPSNLISVLFRSAPDSLNSTSRATIFDGRRQGDVIMTIVISRSITRKSLPWSTTHLSFSYET